MKMWKYVLKHNTQYHYCLQLVTLLIVASTISCRAASLSRWDIGMGASGRGMGYTVGAYPGASKGYDGYAGYMVSDLASWDGVFTLAYHIQSSEWQGPSGFYPWDPEPLMVSGENRTWSDIYLWAQNTVLTTPYRITFGTGTGDRFMTPIGYKGHLVLDYVPAECQWNGPMDFWLDLGKNNDFVMPTIVTADPLQGTRFHLDVYAPVPEPSSLAALAGGLLGIGGLMARRRK